jgi:hypothetical protein
MLSTKVMPEVVEYPEDGTVCVLTRPPFAPREPGEDPADRLMLLFDDGRQAVASDRCPTFDGLRPGLGKRSLNRYDRPIAS